jgi:hypothetical protein
MMTVSDWWAAFSQKAPYSDSGPKALTLAADLLRLAPQLDWPAPQGKLLKSSEDDEENAASAAMERRQCRRENPYDVMKWKKLECYLVRCKDTLAV